MRTTLVFSMLLFACLTFGEDEVLHSVQERSVNVCPGGWTPYDGHCYKTPDRKGNWDFAQGYCHARNGYLVEIQSEGEQQFVHGLLKGTDRDVNRPSLGGICRSDPLGWLGLTDVAVQGAFIWANSSTAPTYTNWFSGEPNNEGGVEECVEIYVGGEWNDQDCLCPAYFVCESP